MGEDGLGPQNCPHEDCGARYAAAVLEAAEGWRCPECEQDVAPCPVCQGLVSIVRVHKRGACSSCETDRRALGDKWRKREREVGV